MEKLYLFVIILKEILKEETDAIKQIHKSPGSDEKNVPEKSSLPIDGILAELRKSLHIPPETEEEIQQSKTDENSGNVFGKDDKPKIKDLSSKTKQIEKKLSQTVLGQQKAVSIFAEGYFQSELKTIIEKDRRRPRATFLFAGPPGVGKTYLSEMAAEELGIPFMRFDMSEYNDSITSVQELIGSDANYKGSSVGLLTEFVKNNPQCILLFDEIEKSCIEVIHIFLQILDAGRVRDQKTDREIDFKDTILIFTTNAGKNLYESGDPGILSNLPRDIIIDALRKDINPKTEEPYFPPAICSRFASGNVVMFNSLDAHSLHMIAARQMEKNFSDLHKSLGISVSMDPHIPTALLLSEGAQADGRSVKNRADSFFGSELYELYRLLPQTEDENDNDTENIKSIHFRVDIENTSDEVKKLFTPSGKIHGLVFSAQSDYLSKEVFLNKADDPLSERYPVFHFVQTADEAGKILGSESIQMIICDVHHPDPAADQNYLNSEDITSPARDFLNEILIEYPGIPMIVIDSGKNEISEEEKISYLRRGVYGFLSLEKEGFSERVCSFTETVFQQNSLSELARSNRLIRFETAQKISEDGREADIIIYDMRLEKAIKAEDTENVLSMLSTPDQCFDDVIGAEDAINELKFFIRYMKEPKKFRREGAAAPKGVLLYGPPGTGKTMLAKAFAAESKATFIAVEGSRFFKGVVGQGADMVRQLFSTARKYAPSVIFIDEIDAIARTRTGRDTDMAQDSEQILTTLLAEMDGFHTDNAKQVFVLGATNYGVEAGASMSLDQAILRRFDRRILIDLPSRESRRIYLEKSTSGKDIFALTADGISSLAERSAGMSLAQLSSVLDMSVRYVLQNDIESVTDQVLEENFETFNNGDLKKWSSDITLRTARHETGHALISWLSGEKPAYLTIASRGNYGGYMQHESSEERMGFTKQELQNRIRIALGGRASEIVYYGKEDGISTGASGDLKTATNLAREMLCTYGMVDEFGLAVVNQENNVLAGRIRDEINHILKRELELAVAMIEENRNKADRLTERLLLSTSLRGPDIDRILTGEI